MRYKSRVLAKHPTARLTTLDYWDDGAPRYLRVVAGPECDATILDIYDTDTTPQQGAAAAWRSAYYWCIRNPAPKAAEISPREEFLWKNPGAVW